MNKTTRTFLSSVIVIVMGALALGSATGPTWTSITDKTLKPINSGYVESNIRIVAEDGSFELSPSKEFRSPFQSNLWNCLGFQDDQILESYQAALNCGAKKVKVYVGQNSKPLYGILALNQSINAATGPSARSYFVKVASDKLNEAARGNTAVSFERMSYTEKWNYNGYYYASNDEKKFGYGWVLWLAGYPLEANINNAPSQKLGTQRFLQSQ